MLNLEGAKFSCVMFWNLLLLNVPFNQKLTLHLSFIKTKYKFKFEI